MINDLYPRYPGGALPPESPFQRDPLSQDLNLWHRRQPDELRRTLTPAVEQLLRQTAPRTLQVRLDQRPQFLLRLGIDGAEAFRGDELRMVSAGVGHKRAVVVVDPRQPSRHARAEVRPNPAQDRHDAASHILAPVVANPFHNGNRAGVTHRKPLPGPAGRKQMPGGSAV